MAVNSVFHTNNLHSIKAERNLYSDLIKEAIQIYGHDVYYMDRTLVARDDILGEDSLSKFTRQHPIEMYVEDGSGGYAGEKEIMSQFGLENRNEVTFVLHQDRFKELDSQITLEDGTGSTGGSILLEAGSLNQTTLSSTLSTVTKSFIFIDGTDSSSTNAGDSFLLEDDNTAKILSEESGMEFYLIMDTATTSGDRPNEGDLVYHPILSKMFEISFVDHDEPFHQLDNTPVYKLRCRQYEYSSEAIDTGIDVVDSIESGLGLDSSDFQFTLEQSSAVNENVALESFLFFEGGLLLEETDGDNILHENDSTSVGERIILETKDGTSFLLQEEYKVGDGTTDTTAQNEQFDAADDSILDFSETNPFGDVGST